MKVIRGKIDGSMNDLDLDIKKTGILKLLESNAISKGTSRFKELYHWMNGDNKIICYIDWGGSLGPGIIGATPSVSRVVAAL